MTNRPLDPFDTQLLRVLCTLVDEGSVSRAAVRLNLSQPAVSGALRRLREIFCDPLLVKDKQRMVPTARALDIDARVRTLLGELDALVAPPPLFDPATTRLAFHLGMPDYLAPGFLNAVVTYLRQHAPGARLVVHALGPEFDFEAALGEGRLDIVIGNWPQPPEHLRSTLLLDDEVVCLLDRQHPGAGGLSLRQYTEGAHIVPMPYSMQQRGVVESHLAQLRLTRHAAVTLPYFGLAAPLLVDTDLIFTTARHFAEACAAGLPLLVVDSPITFPRMRFSQLWHTRTHTSQAHAWLRSVLAAVGRTEAATRRLRRTPAPSA